MKQRQLTPKAKLRRLIVATIEVVIVSGVMFGIMAACGCMCAVAGYP